MAGVHTELAAHPHLISELRRTSNHALLWYLFLFPYAHAWCGRNTIGLAHGSGG